MFALFITNVVIRLSQEANSSSTETNVEGGKCIDEATISSNASDKLIVGLNPLLCIGPSKNGLHTNLHALFVVPLTNN